MAQRFAELCTDKDGCDVLKDHIRELELALRPGLTKFNWMTQWIVSFINNGNCALEKFKSILEKLRKYSAAIEEAFCQIEDKFLICIDDFILESNKPMGISESSNVVESVAEERI
eukprot:3156871-Ditylum_brightwellii.AAC.1